ncbi:hypothetical protein C8Q75DRAFT_752158 [Abortiporus biennis]|nr:hypothetical protein C8Q75DRAFT_752158 [Abortiporus biennis]
MTLNPPIAYPNLQLFLKTVTTMHPSVLSVFLIFVLYSLCQYQVTATPISARLNHRSLPPPSYHPKPSHKLHPVQPNWHPMKHGTGMPPNPIFGY